MFNQQKKSNKYTPFLQNIDVQWFRTISDIGEKEWKKLLHDNISPFFEYHWLHNLEKSACVEAKKGILPYFLAIKEKGKFIAIAPLYLKTHSFGEFVFDNVFYQTAFEAGLSYYPKLVGCTPFTPVIGYKFLINKYLR